MGITMSESATKRMARAQGRRPTDAARDAGRNEDERVFDESPKGIIKTQHNAQEPIYGRR